MFARLISLIGIFVIVYVMLVFLSPNIADQYWDKDINAKIREFKDQTLHFASGSEDPKSLFEKVKSNTDTYIKETKEQAKELETTVNTKIEQAKEASNAVQNAYSGVIDAKQKIQILTGTGK
jgi:hypothetical protein